MALDFRIPARLRDVEEDSEQGLLYAKQAFDVTALPPEEVTEMIKGLAFELADKDVLCVEDEDVFSQAYSLVRDFQVLQPTAKGLLVDSIGSNFSCLPPSIASIISTWLKEGSGDSGGSISAHMHSHRNALKIYTFFLHYLIVAAEKEPPITGGGATGQAAGKGRQGKRKDLPAKWDWELQRLRVVRPMAAALETDLSQLYRGAKPEESLINTFLKTSFTLLENPAVLKDKDLKEVLFTIVACCSIKYGYIEAATSSIIHLISKDEQFATPLAELVAFSEHKFNKGTLAASVIREIGRTNPKVFLRDTKGAKSVGDFLVALADKLPKIMAMHVSLLLPYLQTEPYIIRNAVVAIMGKMVVRVYSEKDPEGTAEGETARVRNKEGMLYLLLERVQDTSAFTRSRVLQIWVYLCEEKAIPLGHWNEVAQLAVGRLEDKSSLVRKSALQLLAVQMQMNPFGSDFASSQIEASLEQWQKKLEEMSPAEVSQSATEETKYNENDESGVKRQETAADGISGNEQEEQEDNGADGPTLDNNGLEEHTENQTQYDDSGPTQALANDDHDGAVTGGYNLVQTRTLIASLKAFLQYTRQLEGAMPVVQQLLASATTTDVEKAIQLLMLAQQFKVDGAEECLRKMLPLVFSQEASIRESVESAIITLYMRDSQLRSAQNLVQLTMGASLGDLVSLEVLIGSFMQRGDITPGMISALWDTFTFNQPQTTAAHSRGALMVLAVAAKAKPEILSRHLPPLLGIGFGSRAREDALLARYTCIALQHLSAADKAAMQGNHRVFAALGSILVDSPLPNTSWYTAAEQAIKAIFVLHPTPEMFCSAILLQMARKLFHTAQATGESSTLAEQVTPPRVTPERDEAGPSGRFSRVAGDGSPRTLSGLPSLEAEADADTKSAEDPTSAPQESPSRVQTAVRVTSLSRFLFIVGHTALEHLVYVENAAKAVRRHRAEKEKAAAQAAADRRDAALASEATQGDKSADKEDINAELGVSASTEAELDMMHERCDREIVSRSAAGSVYLIGAIAPLVARICRNASLLQQHSILRTSAMLALSKLMAIDATFCEDNLQLLFTVVQKATEESVRSNGIIALGDLAFRFPNLVEPWTEHMYKRLTDESQVVRKNTVMVLSHLILNDMMKVKGHISELALRIEDPNPRIADLVKLFFHELSKKGNKPIYNLLPDILSRLSRSTDQETLRTVMTFLIGFIEKDKQMEGLVEKLCNRFTGTRDVKHWQDIAYCLSLLSYSEKVFRRLIDSFPLYKDALCDVEVVSHFNAVISKAKKFVKQEQKVTVEEFEQKMTACHQEKLEEEAAASKAREHGLRKSESEQTMDASDINTAEETPESTVSMEDGDTCSAAMEGASCSSAGNGEGQNVESDQGEDVEEDGSELGRAGVQGEDQRDVRQGDLGRSSKGPGRSTRRERTGFHSQEAALPHRDEASEDCEASPSGEPKGPACERSGRELGIGKGADGRESVETAGRDSMTQQELEAGEGSEEGNFGVGCDRDEESGSEEDADSGAVTEARDDAERRGSGASVINARRGEQMDESETEEKESEDDGEPEQTRRRISQHTKRNEDENWPRSSRENKVKASPKTSKIAEGREHTQLRRRLLQPVN